jgi:hypothetical protein
MADMEEERWEAERHVQHIRALKVYQQKSKLASLSETDLRNLLYDEEMLDNTIAGASEKLTPQSLSWNGYSDSDSDYIP